MKREEYKNEILERSHNCKPKEFNIEKVSLSDAGPILQIARRWVGDNPPKLSESEMENWIKQAEEFIRPRTPEVIEQAKRDIKYPGLPYHMRGRRTSQSKRAFFGIKIGWIYE